MLGIAVVGLGVGEQHALTYSRLDGCELRWLYDVDRERGTRVAARIGQGGVARSFDEILGDVSVDVVSIASYDDCHYREVCAALRAGKHVFVEKPLCRSASELLEVKRTWLQAADRRLASNLVLRAAPLYGWLRSAIAGRELGDIYAFDGEYLYGRLEKLAEGWRADVRGYSVMQGGGVHLVDLMLWLTGQKPQVVMAMGNAICTAGTRFAGDDYVAATFQFPSGLVGRVTGNFGCVHRHHHIVRVFGTKATFVYDDQGPRLHVSRDPGAEPTRLGLPALPATKGELIPEFVRAIVEGRADRARTQHDYDVMSVCLTVDQALAGGAPAKVDYV